MWSGSMVALVTPFRKDFTVDYDAYGRLVDFHLEHGTNAIVPCGCTGEAATLEHLEQKECIRFVVERVAGRVPVIAGAGSNSTREAIKLTGYAAGVGADGALLITPYYNKPTPAGQIAHYQAVATAVPDLPLVLYNVPSRTGIELQPPTVAELTKINNVVAIKEAGGKADRVAEILSLCDITVISGDDGLTLPMMALGAIGVISVAANVVPQSMAGLCRYCLEGDFGRARDLHYHLLGLFRALFAETNPMPVKAALAEMGLIQNVLRLPLVPMTSPMFGQHLKPVMEELGLI